MNLISDIPLVQQLISLCKLHSLQHIVISPGSRNAPLTLSFSNDPYFKCYSIVDERCAGFFAMGIAQQTKSPVALVCTSGSALLNYYPSITEAFYSDIPLVVLSADRPEEYIDIGDGQTIRQEHVFKNHICYEANLKNNISYSKSIANSNKELISKALIEANSQNGPVHINIPLYEPLYNTIERETEVARGSKVVTIKNDFQLNDSIVNSWKHSNKKMVLVGVLPPNEVDNQILDNLLNDPGVLVFTETTSNLYHPKIISNIDRVIAELNKKEKEALHPDLLLTFGGLIVSKKIKSFLREFQPKTHFHISNKRAYNIFGCLTDHIKSDVTSCLSSLQEIKKNSTSNYQEKWLHFHDKLKKGHDNYISEIPYSDFSVFHQIVKRCDFPLHLQLSNSSTIRYTQLFELSDKVEVFCNRGTSGIDGSTSTAIGASIIQDKPTLLITGDLSFFYDSNALWNNYIPNNFKIIIINNSGGGIFRILPGDKETKNFETYLETTHNLKANHLASMYGFKYLEAEAINLEQQLDCFFKLKNKTIIEINTPRRLNDVILLKYFKKIRK